jgi:thymidine kinase
MQCAHQNIAHFPAQSASTSNQIKTLLESNPRIKVLGIDELQFFDKGIIPILKQLRENGTIVLTAGLDYDYQGNIWETTEELKKIADRVEQLFAVCTICHKKIATKTARVSNSLERVLIGGQELYEPRCEEHFKKGN